MSSNVVSNVGFSFLSFESKLLLPDFSSAQLTRLKRKTQFHLCSFRVERAEAKEKKHFPTTPKLPYSRVVSCLSGRCINKTVKTRYFGSEMC